ncbi:glycoside hydrolase family 30 protein [Desertivirga brevis]|uniref:glycoside hydrolase family 30 protein n=1 Tax=Desertivirga brevis TaxID=2810310 RepID=UPI001A958C4A|nr:glycoside hydrolase family 30 protein [Pedobacter sp. SYSU D00873]
MKIKHITAIIPFLIFAGIVACGKDKDSGKAGTSTEIRKISVTIDLNKTYQTIDNFGASDAWACQFVGNWPDTKKNAIADLLFSKKLKADGSPEGIGLSMWRFNLGAGSAQQGSKSGIADEWRRAESFLDDNGNYNWNLQAGQMWFLKAAKERGVNQFLAFTNSPPVQFTITKKAFANSSMPNLSAENYPSFANYLATAIKGIYDKTGVAFNYVSPVNEPQWDWSNGGQEGTPFTNNNISGIVKALDASLKTTGLQTKILVSEAGQYEFLYSAHGKADKGNQIDAFFNPSSADYIGNLTKVEKLIAAHSYFTTSTYAKAVSIRKEMASKLASTNNLKLWQSEYCILGDNENEIKGEGRDLGMASALYLARVIHNDLVNAGASAWQWWTAVSPYDYKDGLVYIDKNKTDGNFYSSKMLWALGNYSRFIVPGSVRLNTSAMGEPEVLISSYKTPDNRLVTVAINSNAQQAELTLNTSSGKMKNLTSYTTNASKDLTVKQGLPAGSSVILEANSITTFISDFD